MNPTPLISATPSELPDSVTVNWRRLSHGLWRDIHAAYSAESFPRIAVFSHEGREAAYRGEVFRLGPKVLFKTSDPTVEEWRRLLRVHYADGGMFAARCTYLDFLGQRFAPNSENEESARQKELAECDRQEMPRTQAEMRRLLEAGGDPANAATGPKQSNLSL